MYWLRRPPYLRWISAGLLLVVGLVIEFRPVATERYPFAGSEIAAGQDVATAIEWREIPAGVLPAWNGDVEGRAVMAIPAGEPLRPWTTAEVVLPSDWWALPLPLPGTVTIGSPIRVVLADGTIAEGIVSDGAIDQGYEPVSMVAFSAADAPQVARAAANDALVVMVGSGRKVAQPNG